MNPGLTLPNCLTSSGDPWAFTSCAGASGSSWGRRKQQWGETQIYIYIYIFSGGGNFSGKKSVLVEIDGIYIYLVVILVVIFVEKMCFSGN